MIQFVAETPNGKMRIISPASWSEITIHQLIELETEWDGIDPIKLFSIVTGLDFELLNNSKQRGLEDKMMAICSFAYNQPLWDNIPRPKRIQIGDNFYETPHSIDQKMLGQKVMTSRIIIESGKDLLSNIPKIVAIYMQPVVDDSEKFNNERATELEKQILNCGALDCYGLGKFFFQKSVNLISFGQNAFQKSTSQTIPIERLLSGLQKLKGSTNLEISQ